MGGLLCSFVKDPLWSRLFASPLRLGRAARKKRNVHIATLDLVSNTCFPLLAADELGLFEAEGLDVSIELNARGVQALRSGACDLLANGSPFGMLKEFPGWHGAKLVVALSQGTPWLLVVRADLAATQGDLNAIKGLRLIAGELPSHALKQLAIRAGIVPDRDFQLTVDMTGTRSRDVSFGVYAARALEAGQFDGFWGNALAAETAVESGAGKVLIDVRRGDDPADVRHYSFAAMATTDAYLERNAAGVEAAVRAVVKAQSMLRADPSLAQKIGAGKFPPDSAQLIARTIESDVEFYDPAISEEAVASMNAFAQDIGYLPGPVPYEQVVDVRMRQYWKQD
jgi:NitT/TauT family transport system substrate-binding protein